MKKKTILIDFDGTINSYRSGWRGDPTDLPDPPNPGAISFLRGLLHDPQFEPVIFTSRMHEPDTASETKEAIRRYLEEYGLTRDEAQRIEVTDRKGPHKLIIDDNAWRFEGTWPRLDELLELTR